MMTNCILFNESYHVPNIYNNMQKIMRATKPPPALLVSLRLGQGVQPESVIIYLGAQVEHFGPVSSYPTLQLLELEPLTFPLHRSGRHL